MAANTRPVEPLGRLLARFGARRQAQSIRRCGISLSAVLTGAADRSGIVAYLHGLGVVVHELADLMRVNDLTDEEELTAYAVEEGVAVSIASEGTWFLFRP